MDELKPTTKTIGLCRNLRTYTQGVTRPATHQETSLGLALKLHEEVGELVRAPLALDEYADVLQALRDFATLNGVVWSSVERAAETKAAQDGTFLPPLLWQATPPDHPKNCKACAHCGSEPDEPYPICKHPDSGTMGLYVGNGRGPDSAGGHCGPGRTKFEQHPLRTPNGELK